MCVYSVKIHIFSQYCDILSTAYEHNIPEKIWIDGYKVILTAVHGSTKATNMKGYF